jgi:NitT/TauT family transport system substrate-binding protein
MPADVSVLSDSMLRETFERYWAAGEASAIDRFKFMKLAWDYLGSEFARCRGGLPMHLCQIGTKSLTVGLFCRSLPIRHFQLGWSPAMKKLTLETTAPFQGLPELVAYDEGLFEREGLQIGWADRNKGNKFDPVATNILSPKGLNPFLSHGKMLEDGQADMYNACEWGNYCRVEETAKASRQVGRRAILTYGAIAVGPKSSVYTPQQLADVTVAVPFYFGTHYLALQLLEGFLPRHMIKVCSAPPPSYSRLKAILSGEVEAATLTEPHISLAEKLGCRIICSAFYHGTEVASERVDGETYAAFNRAVREAVRRINANKAAYMHYFIDYHVQKGETDVALLKVADLREGRLVVADPAPIPVEELQRTAEWLKSWGMLEKTESPAALVDDGVQGYAHIAAE